MYKRQGEIHLSFLRRRLRDNIHVDALFGNAGKYLGDQCDIMGNRSQRDDSFLGNDGNIRHCPMLMDDILHGIETRLPSGDETCCPDSANGKNLPAFRVMGNRHNLIICNEHDIVFANDAAAADGMNADLMIRPFGIPAMAAIGCLLYTSRCV